MGSHRSKSLVLTLTLALVVLAQFGPAATTANALSPAVAGSVVAVTPLPFADSISWHGFVRYWHGFVNRADRVVMVVGLVAAAALFIITRGKWLK